MRKRKSLFLLAPFFLAIIVLINFESTRQKETEVSLTSKRETPQFFLDQALTTYYNSNGTIEYKLHSEHLEYFDDGKIAQIWKPYFILYDKEGKSWHSQSEQATLFNHNGDIQLTGNVHIWQPENNVSMKTSSLLISDSRSTAKTDQWVDFKFYTGTAKSLGMKINFNSNQLQLLSKATGLYHVKK